MRRREVPLEAIDLSDETFRVRSGGPDGTLLASVRASGVVNPPWLRRLPGRGREAFQVIAGFRRILALQALGVGRVDALLIEPGGIDDAHLMEAVFLENLTGRGFDPLELSRALVRLKGAGVPDRDLLRRCLPAAGLGGDPATLDLYLSLVTLPPDLCDAISSGAIDPAAVARVRRRFAGEDGERILRLIRDLRFGVNRQRELIGLLADLVRRDGVRLEALLADGEIAALLRRRRENAPQAGRALIERLRRRRAPRSMAMLDAVRARIRAVGTGPAVTIEASPWLEERRLRFAFTVRSREEFREVLGRLLEADDRGGIAALLADLFGPDPEEGADPGREDADVDNSRGP
jgi:hypothetical protein